MHNNLEKSLKSFIDTAKKPVISIIGATATGKTAISLDIAKRYNGEIISTDSRQIYRHMDIATDAILPEETQGIPHHMIRIAQPDEIISLSDFVKMAKEIIKDIHSRGKVPMLVGGTWLYISALTDAYALTPVKPDPALRKEMEELAKTNGNKAVHQVLEDLDPKSAETIHQNNLRYVIRAIEIARATGSKDNKKIPSPYDVFKLGLKRPRQEIYDRINARVDVQVQRGLLEEVKNLLDKNYDLDLPSMTSLGVKEIIPYLRGEDSLENCLETLKKNTRHYAKRQMSWYRRFEDIYWITQEEKNEFLNQKHE